MLPHLKTTNFQACRAKMQKFQISKTKVFLVALLLFLFFPLPGDAARQSSRAVGGRGGGKGGTRGPPCTTPAVRNGAAKLRRRGARIKYKCYSGFALIGHRRARCQAGEWFPPGVPTCVSGGCPAPPEVAHALAEELKTLDGVSLPTRSVFSCRCLPGHHISGSSLIWCDSYIWNSTTPTCSASAQQPRTTCNFDDVDVDPLCGWQQAFRDNGDWDLASGPTQTLGTGPAQAAEGTHYLLLEASLRLENTSAQLISPVMQPNASVSSCFLFRFHMQGADAGEVVVGQALEDGLQPQELARYSGDHGADWQVAGVAIRVMSKPWVVWIQGRLGPSYLSDIGLDSFALMEGERCTALPTPSPPSQIQPSPASCRQRCDTNITQGQRNAWTEGICGCTPTCFLEFGEDCCHDYTSLCGIHNIEPRMDSVPWPPMSFVLSGLLIVMAATAALILLLGRRRRRGLTGQRRKACSQRRMRGGGARAGW